MAGALSLVYPIPIFPVFFWRGAMLQREPLLVHPPGLTIMRRAAVAVVALLQFLRVRGIILPCIFPAFLSVCFLVLPVVFLGAAHAGTVARVPLRQMLPTLAWDASEKAFQATRLRLFPIHNYGRDDLTSHHRPYLLLSIITLNRSSCHGQRQLLDKRKRGGRSRSAPTKPSAFGCPRPFSSASTSGPSGNRPRPDVRMRSACCSKRLYLAKPLPSCRPVPPRSSAIRSREANSTLPSLSPFFFCFPFSE